MANKGLTFLLFAGAAGAAYYLTKARGYSQLQFYPKSFKFTGGIVAPKLTYIMDVVNPTTATLTLNNIFGNVYIADRLIGRIEFQTKTFMKTGTTTIGVPVILFTGGVASALVSLLQGGYPQLKILGTVNAEGFQSPLNETVPLLP